MVEAAMSASGKRFRLLAVWLLLAGLVGAIVVIERTDLVRPQPSHDGHGSSAARLLLPVPVQQLGAIEVVHSWILHRFERDAAGVWFYHVHSHGAAAAEGHSHDTDPAVAARLEEAFAAFGRTRLERQFALKTDARDYGVTRPEMLIMVYRPNDLQPLAQYAIGDLAPDMLSRYVLIVGSAAVVTIPNYQIDNLLGLIEAVAGKAPSGRATRSGP
jgi:hypothetical protein